MIPKSATALAVMLPFAVCALGQTPAAPKKQSTRPAPQQKKSAAGATAAPAASGPKTAPLAEIHVTGNRNYKEAAIAAASGLRIGQPMRESDFEPARERLMATGGFETIGYKYAPSADGKGYSLTFEVVEIERTLPIRFEELPAPAAELQKVIRDKEPLFGGERAPGHQAVLDRMAGILTSYLKSSKGYTETVVAKVSADVPAKL